MNKKSFLLLSFILAAGYFPAANAADTPVFRHDVSTGTMARLLHGPNALGFFQKNAISLIRTETPFEVSNSSAITRGVMLGRYRSPKATVDLELKAELTRYTMDTQMTTAEIDAIVFEWEENYASPDLLKKFNPRLKRLTFTEGRGLRYDMELKGKFPYLLSLEIPYDATTRKLADMTPKLKDVKKFIGWAEGDAHARTILQNNKSGMPAYITFWEEGGPSIRLHHPLHEVRYDLVKRTVVYSYTDNVEEVGKLPEVKQIMKDAQVQAFIMEAPEPVRIRLEGSPKTGFKGGVIKATSGTSLLVQLEKKKVTVGNK